MITIKDKEKCCGCSACFNICPTLAIAMKSDDEGFLYPVVDLKKCVNCHLCEQVCQYLTKDKISPFNPHFYAAIHKDEDIRKNSRSGGAFTALSDIILAKKGVIYGAILDDKLKVVHTLAKDKKMRDKMRCSKYVQSDLKNVFKQIKDNLKNNIPVLFTGTSCQVVGLKNYLSKAKCPTSNLFLVDILCYGVPSPLVWEEYKKYCEDIHQGKITKVVFRNKEKYGWNNYVETICIDGKPYDSKKYRHLFLNGYNLRPSCYSCPHKSLHRLSDLTIGDFWGIDDVLPNFNDNKGVSLIMIHSDKGRKLFDEASINLNYEQTNSAGNQKALKEPFPKPEDREKFWQIFKEKGLKYFFSNL